MAFAIVRVLRPKQWAKNLLVFAAPMFTGSFSQSPLLTTLAAFWIFSLASSATYIFNDIYDRERDQRHPRKKNRPIAAGEISPRVAGTLGVILALGALAAAYVLEPAFAGLIGAYFALQLAYNAGIKHVPIADVFVISIGFVLRAVAGALVIHVAISAWLLFCTAALALMLGFSKRRDEFLRSESEDFAGRESIQSYSKPILDMLVGCFAAAANVSYGIYSINSATAVAHPGLIVTTLFVWYGCARYLYLVFAENKGEEPETILMKDVHIHIALLGFAVSAALAVTNQLPMSVISR